jgi:hypothetical protein
MRRSDTRALCRSRPDHRSERAAVRRRFPGHQPGAVAGHDLGPVRQPARTGRGCGNCACVSPATAHCGPAVPMSGASAAPSGSCCRRCAERGLEACRNRSSFSGTWRAIRPAASSGLFAAAGYGVDFVELHRGQAIPALDRYDLMLVLGGAMQTWEEDCPSVAGDEKQAIAEWVASAPNPISASASAISFWPMRSAARSG